MPPHRNHTKHFLQLQVQERAFQSSSASLLKELENDQTLDSSKESQCTSNPGSSPIVPASAVDDTQTAMDSTKAALRRSPRKVGDKKKVGLQWSTPSGTTTVLLCCLLPPGDPSDTIIIFVGLLL